MNAIYIADAGKMGRGVFAGKDFKERECIEKCPVIIIPGFQEEKWRGNVLEEYAFGFEGNAALALGYGSLYNHSETPNATYEFRDGHVLIRASHLIKKGEQIFIDYGWNEDELKSAWKNFRKLSPTPYPDAK